MRSVFGVAILVPAIFAAAPAAAQVTSPGPVYYNQSGAPIPSAPQSGVWDPAGPAYYNSPPAAVSPNPPSYNTQQGGPTVWQNGRWVVLPPRGAPQQRMQRNPQRWGGMIGGRWAGGMQAPGGWSAYRRQRRGASLPPYWMSGAFQIPDYLSFGLAAPPYGYGWVRYYDDAVLVDAQGRVWDW